MRSVLSVGPDIKWFFPFVVLGEVRTSRPNSMPYGFAHWYLDAEGKLCNDTRTFYSAQGVRWAAEHLYRTHEGDCRCIAVFYWEPATVNYGVEHYAAVAS
ncbi:hypothetical protein [Clavibacter nebraskensis]|nr:hypothetical protein [Clavibacter nebraskensis]KXU20101.1 hypothetical protein VV38_10575 [Clavibacter nebraskensis]OAH19617.1 hypothetical protein A3Q38_08100 [Clavibacter nebraskensis]UQB10017.1 hypothetical protein LIX19_002191 [Clavibacter nebraskensis]